MRSLVTAGRSVPLLGSPDQRAGVSLSGWWLVEKEDKQMAWFPAPYLEKLDDDGDEDETDAASDGGEFLSLGGFFKRHQREESF